MGPKIDLVRKWSTKLRPKTLQRKFLQRSMTEQQTEPLLVRQAIEDETDSEAFASQDEVTSSTSHEAQSRPSSSLAGAASESRDELVSDHSDGESTIGVDTEPFPEFDPSIVFLEQEPASLVRVEELTVSVEDDPDAITPAPPPKEEKAESRISVVSTVIGSATELQNVTCSLCGSVIGRCRSTGKIERSAYLPCGHVFGHECLFQWISNPQGIKRCPLENCISIRHDCEHSTLPTETPPTSIFRDVATEVLPWNYEFCKTPKGIKLHDIINTNLEKVRRLDVQKRLAGRSPLNFTIEAKRRWCDRTLEETERKLDELQKSWWAIREVEHGRTRQSVYSRAWAWSRMGPGSISRSSP